MCEIITITVLSLENYSNYESIIPKASISLEHQLMVAPMVVVVIIVEVLWELNILVHF